MKGTDGVMKFVLGFAVISVFCLVLLAAAPQAAVRREGQSAASGGLPRLGVSLSYGMNYSPAPGSHEMFTNVFVQRWAYEEFLKSGKWPEESMFVIDVRDAESKGSINKKGHFQTDLIGLEVEVKDSTRNPNKWAYYGCDPNAKTAEAMSKVNDCWSCHDQHATVEHTFVQFYPTLKPVSKNFGTYNEIREKVR
jgi:hypothetical protein